MTSPRVRDDDPFALIAPHYDALMANVPYHAWAGYIAQLAGLAGRPVRPGGKLLDLATGTGSIALSFAARGSVVTGIDRSEPMLVQARRKAAEQALNVTFLCCDLADFHLSPEFHHAVCVYDSLNYLLDPDHVKHAFANVRAALDPEGTFIFDVNTVHALEAELFTQKSPIGAPVEYRWNSKYDPNTRTSRIKMHFRVQATGEKIHLVHKQRAYTDADLRSFLSYAGFRDVRAYEAYHMSRPQPRSDRVFYLASVAPFGPPS